MDTLLEFLLLPATAAFAIALGRQNGRLQRVESKLDWLYNASGGLHHRVHALESRGLTWAPSPAAPPPVVSPTAPLPVAQPSAAAPVTDVTQSPDVAPDTLPLVAVLAAAPPPAIALPPAITLPPAIALPPDEPAREAAAFEWERWVGVRGAAALGAGILVIALLYFLRYSMNEGGWLTLGRRIVLGGMLSAGAVAFAQLRLRRTHAALASWITGAGVAGSYASVWAAQYLGGFLGAPAAFALVVALTAGCAALALRTASLPIALLGTAGGFAAPLSLALDGSQPLGVVAYVIVLDLGAVALAIRNKWWSPAALALAASAGYEAAWLSSGEGAGALPFHLGVLAVCAGVFAALPAFAVGDGASGEELPPPLARLMRYTAVGLPYAFAAKLASGLAASEPLLLGTLLVVLTALSVVIARRRRERLMPIVAATGNAIALLAWAASGADVAAHLPAALALTLALLAPFGVLARLEIARPRGDAGMSPAMTAGAGAVLLTVAAWLVFVATASSPDAYLFHDAAWLGLAGLGVALARVTRTPALATGSFVSLSVALGIGSTAQLGASGSGPSFAAFVVGGAALAAAFGFARVRPADTFSPGLGGGARWGALVLLVALALHARALPSFAEFAIAAALALVMLLSRGPLPLGYPGLGFLLAVITLAEAWGSPRPSGAEFLACGGALALLFLATPFVARRELLESASLPRGHALAIILFGLVLASPFLSNVETALTPTLASVGGTAALSFVATRAFAQSERARRAARSVGVLALVLIFAWANAAVIGGFAPGPAGSFETGASQARDLTMSLVWAAYGVGLLALGMRRGSGALRSASLVLILATAGKAFLYDLSQLEDLYRVGSLVALAGSLLGISVLYQRYVFGAVRAQASGGGGGRPPAGVAP